VGPAFPEYPVQESEPNIPQWVKMVSTPLGQFRHACQLQFEQPNYSGENIQNFHNSVNLVYPGYSPEYISNVVNQVPLAYKKYTEIGVGAFGNLNHPLWSSDLRWNVDLNFLASPLTNQATYNGGYLGAMK
jgi:hypothetical protein